MQGNQVTAQQADAVELTVRVPKATWETLVEFSRSQRHNTPADTVLMALYPVLDAFLRGKGLGVEVGSATASKAFENVVNALTQPKGVEKV